MCGWGKEGYSEGGECPVLKGLLPTLLWWEGNERQLEGAED